jgi:hypothetical protein
LRASNTFLPILFFQIGIFLLGKIVPVFNVI